MAMVDIGLGEDVRERRVCVLQVETQRAPVRNPET